MRKGYVATVLVILLAAFGFAGWKYSQDIKLKKVDYSYENPYLISKGQITFNGESALYSRKDVPGTTIVINYKCTLNFLSKQSRESLERILAIKLLTITFSRDKLDSSLLYTGLNGPPRKDSIEGLNMSIANCLMQK